MNSPEEYIGKVLWIKGHGRILYEGFYVVVSYESYKGPLFDTLLITLDRKRNSRTADIDFEHFRRSVKEGIIKVL